MPLELNAALQRKLQAQIAETLRRATLTSYGSASVLDFWPLTESGEQALHSLNQEARDNITEWLGNSPIFSLVFNQVLEEIDSIDRDKREAGAALTSLPGFEDAQARSQQFVLQLMALPHEYVVSFPLSDGLASFFQNRGFGPLECGTVNIAGSWHGATSNSFPPVPMLANEQVREPFFSGLSMPAKLPFPAPVQELSALCVQIRVGGLITGMTTEPIKRARDELKALIGLAVATDLVKEQFGMLAASESARFAQAHEMRDSSWVALTMRRGIVDVPAPISKTIFNPEVEDIYPRLESLVRLLGTPRVGARLKLAGRWMFDAWANSSDPVMRFMQFAIAMEVLLQSDPGDSGLTKTLANRCAYLIATSTDEREAIRKEFPKLYSLRSKIVHNGTDRFSRDEHALARRFREICGRVVAAEMRLALADVTKGA